MLTCNRLRIQLTDAECPRVISLQSKLRAFNSTQPYVPLIPCTHDPYQVQQSLQLVANIQIRFLRKLSPNQPVPWVWGSALYTAQPHKIDLKISLGFCLMRGKIGVKVFLLKTLTLLPSLLYGLTFPSRKRKILG